MQRMQALERTLAIGLAVTLSILTAGVSHSAGAPVLKVTGSLWTPYIDDELPEGGLAADLVRSALTRAGYELEPTMETWSRAYKGAAVGVYDVVAAAWQNSERSVDLLFSEPYLLNDIVLLARKGIVSDFESLSDLTGYRIGVVRGYAYDDAFDNNGELNRISNNHLIQNLLLLRQGKIDLLVGDKWSIFHQISRFMPDDLDRFTLLARPIARRGLRLGVSRQNHDAGQIIERFDAAMAEMKSDGSFQTIMERHTSGVARLPGKR